MEKQQDNFKFKKKFGQNFLTDTNLLKAIVTDAGVSHSDEVLEIGTGAGALTKELATVAKKVVAYEIDKDLKPILNQNLKAFDNIEIFFDDILKVQNKQIKKHFSKPFKVVANLPYYITTPIIFKFLEGDFDLTSLTVMVQKEVAQRLTAKENSKAYGILTIMINAVSRVTVTRNVNRKMFKPQPNVDSSIVHIELDKNKYDIKNFTDFKKVVKASFAMRRKTLQNNFKKAFGLDTQTLNIIFKNLNLQPNVRAEQLTINKFIELTNSLSQYL